MEEFASPVQQKVAAIFREMAVERASALDATRFPAGTISIIAAALAGPNASTEEILQADEIAFHLCDWNADAAFLVALQLFPERFTPEEIEEGVTGFLIHAPHHVIAAARLAGHPTDDIFKKA